MNDQPSNSSECTKTDDEACADELLIDFLRDRDVACPKCAYNLRDLEHPTCPECGLPLTVPILTAERPVALLLWLLAPCGVTLVATALLVGDMLTDGRMEYTDYVVGFLAFGAASGLLGLLVAICWRRFLRLSSEAQWRWAASCWVVHALVYIVYIAAYLA